MLLLVDFLCNPGQNIQIISILFNAASWRNIYNDFDWIFRTFIFLTPLILLCVKKNVPHISSGIVVINYLSNEVQENIEILVAREFIIFLLFFSILFWFWKKW